MIWDGDELFAVEAPGDSSVPAGSAVIWRLADAWVPPGAMTCGASSASGNAAAWFGGVVAELGKSLATAPGAVSQIDLGMIGDFRFFNDHGAGTEAAIMTRMNNVDVIFSEQLGVQLNVAEVEIFTSETEPFSDTTVPGDLLDELAGYRFNTPGQRAQGLTHLFSGRDLNGNTVGIAFTGALCSARLGAGLTASDSGATIDSLVAAHEIGHNFGAPHDGEAESPCETETGAFLMAPNLNGSDRFSQCSIDQMTPEIAAASCIVPLPTIDLTVDIDGHDVEIFLGNSVQVAFVVTNVGTEPAGNGVMEISLPDILTLSPDQITQVSCVDDGTGHLTCPLDTLAGGSFVTAGLQLIATSSGTGDLVAFVTADGDDNPANDVETAQVTVLPAVDLAVNAIGATQVNLNQGASATLQLENLSVLGATSVELTVELGNGLRATDATWPLGACTVAASRIDCTADSFAAESGTTLEIGFTGIAAGQAAYTVSLTSVEADADSSNNSATGNVTVTDPAASSGGGGGGAAGFAWLLLLLAAPALARRSTRRRRAAA